MTATEHDPAAARTYLRPDVPYVFGVGIDHARRIDCGADGLPLGVKVLGVSRGVDLADFPQHDALVNAGISAR